MSLASNEYRKRRRQIDPAADTIRNKRISLKAKYGLTLEQYNEMLINQGNVCAMGILHDSILILESAIKYLQNH